MLVLNGKAVLGVREPSSSLEALSQSPERYTAEYEIAGDLALGWISRALIYETG